MTWQILVMAFAITLMGLVMLIAVRISDTYKEMLLNNINQYPKDIIELRQKLVDYCFEQTQKNMKLKLEIEETNKEFNSLKQLFAQQTLEFNLQKTKMHRSGWRLMAIEMVLGLKEKKTVETLSKEQKNKIKDLAIKIKEF